MSGLLDDATLRFLMGCHREPASGARRSCHYQLNSPAAIGDSQVLPAASGLLAAPPLPLVVWLGPLPPRPGGAAQFAGLCRPRCRSAGHPHRELVSRHRRLDRGSVCRSGRHGISLHGRYYLRLIDQWPSIRQLIQDLDGENFVVDGREVTVATISPALEGDGITTVPTTFTQPGLLLRFAHLSLRPKPPSSPGNRPDNRRL